MTRRISRPIARDILGLNSRGGYSRGVNNPCLLAPRV